MDEKLKNTVFLCIMSVEAGYQNIPQDSGNYIIVNNERILIGTKYGVSAPTLARYMKRKLGKDYITSDDMRNLKIWTAREIFEDFIPKRKLPGFRDMTLLTYVKYHSGRDHTEGTVISYLNNLFQNPVFGKSWVKTYSTIYVNADIISRKYTDHNNIIEASLRSPLFILNQDEPIKDLKSRVAKIVTTQEEREYVFSLKTIEDNGFDIFLYFIPLPLLILLYYYS